MKIIMQKAVGLYMAVFLSGCVALPGLARAEYVNDIYYMCAAWGPDGDTIYFVKQILFSKRTGGTAGRVENLGGRLWFCKMNWDGSGKEEICELWLGENTYVDINGNAMWLDVCAANKKAAFSVEFGTGTVGIWVIDLDGKNLHRPFELPWSEKQKWRAVHPSWNPDGTKIVYCEQAGPLRLAVYDLVKKERKQLTDGPRDEHPVWSPQGDWIAYTHYVRLDARRMPRRIWRIKPDGSEAQAILDAKGKDIFGWWPSWSPDGARISAAAGVLLVIDPKEKTLNRIDTLSIFGERLPNTMTNHHWGKRGWLESYGYIIRVLETSGGKALVIGPGTSCPVNSPRDLSTHSARWGEPAPAESSTFGGSRTREGKQKQ